MMRIIRNKQIGRYDERDEDETESSLLLSHSFSVQLSKHM